MAAGIRWALMILLGLCSALFTGWFQHVNAPAGSAVFPLENVRITVDPGHGGIDPGCHRGDLLEKDVVLSIALRLAQTLEEKGASVTLTRTMDTELSHLTDAERTRHRRDLRARVELANNDNADLLISLHINTAASHQLGGAMTFYHPSSSRSKSLAHFIIEELQTAVPGNQNGALPGNFYILRHSAMPAVLVEMGFLTHVTDRLILTDPEGQHQIITSIVTGIEKFLTHPELPEAPNDATSPTGMIPLPLLDDHPCVSR